MIYKYITVNFQFVMFFCALPAVMYSQPMNASIVEHTLTYAFLNDHNTVIKVLSASWVFYIICGLLFFEKESQILADPWNTHVQNRLKGSQLKIWTGTRLGT